MQSQTKYGVCINVYGSGQYVIGWNYTLTKAQWEELNTLGMKLHLENE